MEEGVFNRYLVRVEEGPGTFWLGLCLVSAFCVQWRVLDVVGIQSGRKNLQRVYEQDVGSPGIWDEAEAACGVDVNTDSCQTGRPTRQCPISAPGCSSHWSCRGLPPPSVASKERGCIYSWESMGLGLEMRVQGLALPLIS